MEEKILINKERLSFELQRIKEKVGMKEILNKNEMLLAIGSNTSSWQRANQSNDYTKFPKPHTQPIEHKRVGNPYFTYEYDAYEIAIFKVLGRDRYRDYKNIEDKQS